MEQIMTANLVWVDIYLILQVLVWILVQMENFLLQKIVLFAIKDVQLAIILVFKIANHVLQITIIIKMMILV